MKQKDTSSAWSASSRKSLTSSGGVITSPSAAQRCANATHPPAIIRRYDLDLKDTIDKINACEIELWGLQEMQMSFR